MILLCLELEFIKKEIRAPLLIPFGIRTQVFFSDSRRQKRQPAGEAGSLALLNEYFGNLRIQAGAVAVKKPKLGSKIEVLEVSIKKLTI